MRTFLIALSVVALIGCSSEEKRTIPSDVSYSITEETPNEALKKTNVNVELNKKVSEKVLSDIAMELRDERQQYERVWIFYHLQGEAPGTSPWATTHFTPELEVAILGSTVEQDEKQSAVKVTDGKEIGRWKDEGSLRILIEIDGKYVMRTEIKEGGHFDNNVVKNGKSRYDDIENGHGEYYVIEPSGNLGMYNAEGKQFAVATNAK